MAIRRLSELSEWKIADADPDVRGWDVVDGAGDRIGTVNDLIVNTDTEYVESLVTEEGTQYPLRNVDIGERVVRLKSSFGMEGGQGFGTAYEPAATARPAGIRCVRLKRP